MRISDWSSDVCSSDLGLLISFVVGAAFLPVPYVAMRPGTARPVTQYVTVRGATSYPPEESIAYMTVNIGQISLLEAAVGWLDDDVDIRPEEIGRASCRERVCQYV